MQLQSFCNLQLDYLQDIGQDAAAAAAAATATAAAETEAEAEADRYIVQMLKARILERHLSF